MYDLGDNVSGAKWNITSPQTTTTTTTRTSTTTTTTEKEYQHMDILQTVAW